jgi:hypothetical protein
MINCSLTLHPASALVSTKSLQPFFSLNYEVFIMTIELSSLTFTNKADIIPQSGTEQIINNGIANTLDGSDIITGTGNGVVRFGFLNSSIGMIDTGAGNDTLTGTNIFTDTNTVTGTGGFRNEGGIINTGDGRDTIAGIGGSADGVFSLTGRQPR